MATFWAGAGRADYRVRQRDSPEKRLQAACRQVAALKGFTVWHLSQARATQQSAGWCDDVLTGGPRLIGVEYKIRPNRQTVPQQAFQVAWEGSGGVYLLVYDLGEFLEALDGLRGGARDG
jgi:hypothetical protein